MLRTFCLPSLLIFLFPRQGNCHEFAYFRTAILNLRHASFCEWPNKNSLNNIRLFKICINFKFDHILNSLNCAWIMQVYSSRYLCESPYSKVKYAKNLYRNRLIHSYLDDILRLACSNSKSDLNEITRWDRKKIRSIILLEAK